MQDLNAAGHAVWSIDLPHSATAVPIARAVVRTALTEIASPAADGHTAELLTSELVANAVLHTPDGDPIQLVVEVLPAGFRVEVHDSDPTPLTGLIGEPPPSTGLDEHGRGLLLIRTLSKSAGCRATTHGKAVWFRLPPAS